MPDAVSALCRTAVPARSLHVERFGPAAGAREKDPGRFEVVLRRSGLRLAVPADRSVLEVVRDHVPDVPCSCEEGCCGSCETPVLAGIPDHRDSVIGLQERAAATTMMICVSRAA